MHAHTGNLHAQNWLRARCVQKPVLAYTKKHAPKFSILQSLKYSNLFLFADDNEFFKIIQIEQDSSLLQYDIDSMYNWMLNSLLSFHQKSVLPCIMIANLLVLLFKLHTK